MNWTDSNSEGGNLIRFGGFFAWMFVFSVSIFGCAEPVVTESSGSANEDQIKSQVNSGNSGPESTEGDYQIVKVNPDGSRIVRVVVTRPVLETRMRTEQTPDGRTTANPLTITRMESREEELEVPADVNIADFLANRPKKLKDVNDFNLPQVEQDPVPSGTPSDEGTPPVIVYNAFTQWEPHSYHHREENAHPTVKLSHSGIVSAKLSAEVGIEDDIWLEQVVDVRPNTWYHLSGWVKVTSDLAGTEQGFIGANVSIIDKFERSASIVEQSDWTWVTLVFNSNERESIRVAARLGFFGSTVGGSALFDDLCLIEIPTPTDPASDEYKSVSFLTPDRLQENLLANPGFEIPK